MYYILYLLLLLSACTHFKKSLMQNSNFYPQSAHLSRSIQSKRIKSSTHQQVHSTSNHLTLSTQHHILDPILLVQAVLNRNSNLTTAYYTWLSTQTLSIQSQKLADPVLSYHNTPWINSEAPYAFRAQLHQKLPWPGKRLQRQKMASNRERQSHLSLQHIYSQLRYQTLTLYYQYYLQSQALLFNQKQQALLQQLIDHGQSAYVHTTKMQTLQIQSQISLQTLKRQVITLKYQQSKIIIALKKLLHWHADNLDPMTHEKTISTFPSPPSQLLLPTLTDSLADLITLNIKHHPQLQKLKAQQQHIQLRINHKKLEAFPDFTLYTQYQSMWMTMENRWWVGVAINLPVWKDSRQAEIQELEWQEKAILADIQTQENEVISEVTQAYSMWLQANKAITQDLKQTLPLAAAHLKNLQNLYEQKELTFHEWIHVAQQQQELLWYHQRSKVDICLAYIALYRWIIDQKPKSTNKER